MASRRMPRPAPEAAARDRVPRYRLERSAAAAGAAHPFRAHSRLLPRPRYNESFHHDGRFPHANCQHEDWSEDPREDYPGENYPGEDYPGENYPGENYPGENYPGPSYRAASPPLRKENYFQGQFSRPAPREREFARDYGKFGRAAAPGREYGQRDREYPQGYGPAGSWQAGAEFGSPDVLGDFGPMEEEYGGAEDPEYEEDFGAPPRRGGAGRGRALRGKRLAGGVVKPRAFRGDPKSPLKKWGLKKGQPGPDADAPELPPDVAEPLQQRPSPELPPRPGAAPGAVLRLPKPAHVFRSLSFDPVDKSDIFSTFGVEIIKWAGFHAVKNDAEFSRLFGALFELETETCAKMLASFKCSLRPEHRDYCFFTIKSLQHAALKTPKVDNEFLNMLLDKGAVKTKNCFFEIIKPFDKYVMRLQDRLLKGVTPLLMACNAYELSVKSSAFGHPGHVAGALETTVSLCRKSLALLGQTFALASVFRQEKILEAVGLQEMAPAPTAFPNFDDSTLFGREYMENLKAWLERSGYPIQMRRGPAGAAEQLPAAAPGANAPQRADRKVVDTIEQLVSSIVAGTLSAKDRSAQKNSPEYWFLCDEDSLEYKYYRLRLSEVQRRSSQPVEEAAPESLRALLYARRVASIKRRLFKRKKKPGTAPPRASRARRVRRASRATQTLLSAGTVLKQPGPARAPGAALGAPLGAAPGALGAPPGAALGAPGALGALGAAPGACPAVDARSRDTAERLARFVAQEGPEMERISIAHSADSPELWFLQDPTSPAFQFYRRKVLELCPSITFSPEAAGAAPAAGTAQQDEDDEDDEEEEEEEEEDDEEEAEFEPSQPAEDEEDDEEDVAAGRRVADLEEELVSRAGEEMAGGDVRLCSPPDGAVPNLSTQAPGPAPGARFPRKRVSSKSLKVGLIPAPKRVCLVQEPKVHEPVRIAYDRPRGCPITKKKKKPTEPEVPPKRLSPRNVGFQMLQRMGWQEGHGLGTRGRGIREPVHLGATSAGEGLGVVGEESREDAFDVFRQRMMHMYRQKRAGK
ncbi:SURP and G-patch domain-containing protein 2 [Lonchura striata]